MTKSINSYADLIEEKARLKLLLSAQKELVRQDINELKQELAPVKSAISLVGKITTKDNTSWLLTTAADTAIDILLKKIVLSRAGWITKLVLPFFMKNFSSHVIADNKDKIVSKLFSWAGKKNGNGKMHKKNKERKEDISSEDEYD
ncbi:MAG: hypothetical protein ABI675_19650 [Chitinophagaceae bacterium]